MKKKILMVLSAALIAGAAAGGICVFKPDGTNTENEKKAESGVESITLSDTEITIYADSSERAQLTAGIYPADAAIRELTWISDDINIVYADKDGYLHPNGVGMTSVRAESKDGSAAARCEVTVKTKSVREAEIPETYTHYDVTLYDLVMDEMAALPMSEDTDMLPAHDEEVEAFANPENFMNGYTKYQYLALNEGNGVSADELDTYLTGKGALSGKGELFKKAAEDNDLSEAFLVTLACLESESGTNELAEGAETNGITVYNPFGAGKTEDASAAGRAQLAYDEGWTSLDDAISGGAKWLSENYINNERYQQNTLYKMRWNLAAPAKHQYSQDIDWADRKARELGPMLEAFPGADYRFDIPALMPGRDVAG